MGPKPPVRAPRNQGGGSTNPGSPQRTGRGPVRRPPRNGVSLSLQQSHSGHTSDVGTPEADPDDARKRYENMMGSYYDDIENGDDGM